MNHFDALRRATGQIVCLVPEHGLRQAGSGVLWWTDSSRRRGHVVTCAHVWETMAEDRAAGARPTVLFRGETSIVPEVETDLLAATVVGHWPHPGYRSGCPDFDLVVLDVQGDALPPPISLAATPPKRGADIALAGWPKLDSGCHFRIEVGTYGGPVDGVVRCNLAAMDGDSGGPVVDLASGKLVGLLSGRADAEFSYGVRVPVSWLVPLGSMIAMLSSLEGSSRSRPGAS